MSTNLSKFRNIHSIAEVESVFGEHAVTKDGVVYLNKPISCKCIDFIRKCPGCDALTDPNADVGNASRMHVVAYATLPAYNKKLSEIMYSSKGKYGYFASIDLEGNTI